MPPHFADGGGPGNGPVSTRAGGGSGGGLGMAARAYDNVSLLLGQRLAYRLCATDMCKLAGPMGASKTACGVNCPE